MPVTWNIYRIIQSAEVGKCLQMDVYKVQKWCFQNYMHLNINTTVNISFARATDGIHFNFHALILRTDSVKYFHVVFDSKLYFHQHVNHVTRHAPKHIWLIRFAINVSILGSLKVRYTSLIRPELEFASPPKTAFNSHNQIIPKNIKQKFARICCGRFYLSDFSYKYHWSWDG